MFNEHGGEIESVLQLASNCWSIWPSCCLQEEYLSSMVESFEILSRQY